MCVRDGPGDRINIWCEGSRPIHSLSRISAARRTRRCIHRARSLSDGIDEERTDESRGRCEGVVRGAGTTN
jgi:hypothetical protein